LILIVFSESSHAQIYRKKINDEYLIIQAPVLNYGETWISGRNVSANFQDMTLRSKQLHFNQNQNTLSLRKGFELKAGLITLTGDDLEYNLNQDYYFADDVTLKFLLLESKLKKLEYFGDHLQAKEFTIGTQVPKAGAVIQKAEVYPGITVAKDSSLYFEGYTLFYFPTLIYDRRRNYFLTTVPYPMLGADRIRGPFLSHSIHYFLNPQHYGALSITISELRGLGLGIDHFFRFSDHTQFKASGIHWQKDEPQYYLGMRHDFLNLPVNNSKNFFDRYEYATGLSKIEAPYFTLDYGHRETINDEVVNRRPEAAFNFGGQIGKSAFYLNYQTALAAIDEYVVPTLNNQWISSTRFKNSFDLYYQEPKPFFNRQGYGVGYTNSNYYQLNGLWERGYGYLTATQKTWFVNHSARYTHYFFENGRSVFRFDQKYALSDNVTYTFDFPFWFLESMGATYLYDLKVNNLFNAIYFATWNAGSIKPRIEFDSLRASILFSVGF
jgi:hypothetical protein